MMEAVPLPRGLDSSFALHAPISGIVSRSKDRWDLDQEPISIIKPNKGFPIFIHKLH